MKLRFPFARATAACVALYGLAAGLAATAQAGDGLSDAELQGQALAQKILAQQPANGYTNSGTLEVSGPHATPEHIRITVTVEVTTTNWSNRYAASSGTNGTEVLLVTHAGAEPSQYRLTVNGAHPVAVDAHQTARPFAGSDFWLCDLGLEFFHWPGQKVLQRHVHRSCACTLLESTNPHPELGGYARVTCWIDNDSLGIVEAYAYDASGHELKNFYPKNLEKVNGQYQVQSMIIKNSQTGSTSHLEFDLDH
jgi:hypothetical protein